MSDALFQGLRSDGTPVVTSSIAQASVYVFSCKGGIFQYGVTNSSQVRISQQSDRINSRRLDAFFSDRLHYRVGETQKKGAAIGDEIEAQRRRVQGHLITVLETEAKAKKPTVEDPLKTLKASIAETSEAIAAKKKISDKAIAAMHEDEQVEHYESLKKLRRALDAMNTKLNRLEQEEEDRKKVETQMPEIYEQWEAMALEDKQRFMRFATKRITLAKV